MYIFTNKNKLKMCVSAAHQWRKERGLSTRKTVCGQRWEMACEPLKKPFVPQHLREQQPCWNAPLTPIFSPLELSSPAYCLINSHLMPDAETLPTIILRFPISAAGNQSGTRHRGGLDVGLDVTVDISGWIINVTALKLLWNRDFPFHPLTFNWLYIQW